MTPHSLVVSLAALLGIVVQALAAESPWFTRHLTGLEVGPTGAQFGHSDSNDVRYAARFDGREIVRRSVAAHSEYLVLWVRDGDYAYYDSKLLPKAPGLGARDPLREALDAARPHGLPIIAYCVVQQGGHFLKAHPEWEMRGADGKPIGRFCFNSGYLEAMKGIVAEQLAYGIAGFHIDMLDQGFGPPYGCWCDTCQHEFQKQHGRSMPKGATWDEDWDRMLEFRYATSDRFEKALTTYIKSINPAATVDFNYHGNPPFSFELGQRPVQHAGNGDFVTGETGVWGFSALTVGLNAAFYRAATPGRQVQVAMQRGVRMYHDQTTRPLADLRWELFTLLAHGAFVTVVDKTGFDGGLDPVAYERFGAAFREVHDKRAHFGQQPVAEVGLYFSHRTRDWLGRDQPANYFQSFQGAHKALVYEHIPFGIILDENATIATLKQFPVVLLPNVAILSKQEVALFKSYVAGGGRMIVTGLSGCYDRLGKVATASALSELTGAKFVRKLETEDNWVSAPSSQDTFAFHNGRLVGVDPLLGAFGKGLGTASPFLVKGPAAIFQPTTARTVGELLKPYRTTRQQQGKEATEWPMSAESTVGRAIFLNSVGQGTVLTFACSPDFATASEHHIVEARKLIGNAVRFLNTNPTVRITAPANVESVVSDDPKTRTLRVHLIGYNSPPQTTPAKERPFVLPMPIEEAPMYRVVVESSRPLKRVEAVKKSTQLKHRGHRIEATVEDIHEVLVLKY
jgi:Hypothetical glycosyl hydrolase 6/Beta-galactosidase trimerisation domain